MITYHMNDMSLEIPSTYVDHSVNVFANSTGQVSINIARDALPPNEPLVQQIRRELLKWGKRAPRFFLIADKPRQVGTLAGHEIRFQWMPENMLLYQHQVYVQYYSRYLTITATGPKKLAAQCDAALDQMIADIKFRKQGS